MYRSSRFLNEQNKKMRRYQHGKLRAKEAMLKKFPILVAACLSQLLLFSILKEEVLHNSILHVNSILIAAPQPLTPWQKRLQEDWYAFNIGVDLLFLVDLAGNFLTAYRDEVANRLVFEPAKIARHYLDGLLVPDVIASVPLTIVSDG